MVQPPTARTIIQFFVFILFSKIILAQPSNDDCANAVLLTSSTTCVNTAGDAANATSSGVASSCSGTVRYDVWYKFVAASTDPTITLSSVGANFNSPKVELFSGTCAGLTSLGCNPTSLTASGLTIGTTYYVRALSTNNPVPSSNATFNICITDPSPPSNDDCANATTLTMGSTNSSGTVWLATASAGIPVGCASGNPDDDVWYKFTATATNASVVLSAVGTNLATSGARMQLFSGSCGSLTSVACAGTSTMYVTGLTISSVYYIRVYSSGTGSIGGTSSGSAFSITVSVPSTPSSTTVTSAGRMKESFQQTILSPANALNTPWEVTYGPDNYLWITESKGYKAYRMDPITGTKITILDISQNASGYLTPAEHTTFNVQFPSSQNPWPQGGFAGLALHPQFNSGKPYVYISYVRTYNGGSSGPGYFFTNSLVRFTYNSSTGKLESPVALCDTLPGSNDHNSQRIIIAPVSGTYYLFYGQGDMGAGQLSDYSRINKAQNLSSYEGKILRFNLEDDGDAGTYDKWIPNNNPYNGATQSAIWCAGIRNNQGFAYDTAKGILYGSSHGPYSDDEINIIEQSKNYGHPLVIGYADGNYNGSTAGTPNNTPTSSLAIITDEVAAAAAISNYKDPLFSGYAPDQTTLHNIWVTNPSNSTWPSEAWSGMDFYSHTLIPGWKNSLVVCSLKWARVLRLKLGSTGTTIVPTNGADTVAYFGGTNRYRDLAFAPNGKDMYVSMEGSSSAGPNASNPVVPACTNCIVKYTFLGYADASGKSSIPDAIDVTAGAANSCTNGTTITIDNTNNNLWVPITGPDGNIMAEIYPNGNNLGTVSSSFYTNTTGTIRIKNGNHYLDRNITITPQFQPSTTVKIRLYITKAEFDALDADNLSGVSSISDVKILKNTDACGSAISSNTTLITPTFAEAHGTNGYVLQGNISSFSSFYFSSSNATLPLTLITFTGLLQNNAVLLDWQTANEINTSQFIIERSIDGQNFARIGTVTALGNNSVNNKYSFTDYDATHQSASVLYYRLKVVDKDGAYTFSKVVTISLPFITGRITMFPNPALNTVNVTIMAPVDGKVHWTLVDNTGRVVIKNSAVLRKGSNSVDIDVEKLSTGFYYLSVVGAEIDQKVKLEKL